MKRLLLLPVLFLIFNLSFSQTVNDIPIEELDVSYLQIVGTSKMFSSKVTITIDMGQKTKFFSSRKETLVIDKDGNQVEFNSMIDALNFMNENGYDFVQAYVITLGNQNVYHYLMKKRE